ncbi:immunoglobulin domain-containing protein [Methanolacinia paynteri]|uniref:immunoglobulin domain-containing protein n=1 Tax=Methanolacinia paynteri TaxID=230356 RepID=UPI0006945A60|nr:immunoglobulin domain-containing protein [Methanolacinia paynteri]
MNSKIISLLIISAAIFCVICPAQAEADAGQSEKITITALGDGSYYNGEVITFSGTDTESDYVYLFIAGPNLNADGDKLDDPGTAAISGKEGTFARAAVDSDDTWEYELVGSRNFDAGSYTIYAVTEPKNKEDLSSGEYDTVSIVIKKPFITAKLSEPVIKRGEELTISGTAEGNPHFVAVWVLGYDYWNGAETGSMVTVVPEDDSSYEYVLSGDETAKMEDGEYYVVVQHSMYNDEFNVVTEPASSGDGVIVTGIATVDQKSSGDSFYISGKYALRGADAAEALIDEINSADIDDTYTLSTFKVEGQSGSNTDNSILSAIGNFFAGIFG